MWNGDHGSSRDGHFFFDGLCRISPKVGGSTSSSPGVFVGTTSVIYKRDATKLLYLAYGLSYERTKARGEFVIVSCRCLLCFCCTSSRWMVIFFFDRWIFDVVNGWPTWVHFVVAARLD